MGQIVKSIDEVEKAINLILSNNDERLPLISIDGKNGSGKSRLAICLCCRDERFIYFDLDTHYWPSNKLPYVNNIDYKSLRKNIISTFEEGKIVVLDGVCILSIIEKLSLTTVVNIYVKKVDSSGWWIDGRDFNYNLDLEELFIGKLNYNRKWKQLEEAKSGKNNNKQGDANDDIENEIIRYHFKFKPNESADVIYEHK